MKLLRILKLAELVQESQRKKIEVHGLGNLRFLHSIYKQVKLSFAAACLSRSKLKKIWNQIAIQ